MNKPTDIDVEAIYLDTNNPRHEPLESQEEAIEKLCQDEYVLQLAQDIAENGINPLESFAVLIEKRGRKTTYIAVEGNRRLCAIKLLQDPDLAPANIRKKIIALSAEAPTIKKVPAVTFKNRDDAKVWIDRIHSGLQGGIGRKPWNAEQKSRFSGDAKNAFSQALLDYAEEESLISPEDRKRKLTTVQRYLSNREFREAIGLGFDSATNTLQTTRPKEDTDKLISVFIADLISEQGEVNSRKNSEDIIAYSRKITSDSDISTERTEKHSLRGTKKSKPGKKAPVKPKKPTKRSKLPYNPEFHNKLKVIPSQKLETLYYSLCDVNLVNHTSLVAVGIWSFIETLTALDGRGSTDFSSYLNAAKLTALGLGTSNKDTKSARDAIGRLADFGNTTKHHKTSTAMNSEQIANDFETTLPVLIALADACAK
ncbi:MAG: hypothetical protein CMI02_07495 [Oceanospirillaceae bacterium]|nr:hypothetical protein [Oceanospirillaceae bacterium]